MYATHMNMHGVCGCERVSETEEERGVSCQFCHARFTIKTNLIKFIVYVDLGNCVQLKYNYTFLSYQ